VILLDASAVLALLHDEPGADVVATALEGEPGALSVLNLAEVLEHAGPSGARRAQRLSMLRSALEVVPMTEDDAESAAKLYTTTRKPALSLADRIALVTARRLRVPVLTAEGAWSRVRGIDVRLIR
jgi:ribonuclease VapC